jgi:hypothetical protein
MLGDTLSKKIPQTQIIALLSELIPLHSLTSKRNSILACFQSLTAQSLTTYPTRQSLRLSTLTGDGLPFELSVSLTPQDSGGLRYVTEAGNLYASFQERLQGGYRSTVAVLESIGAEHLESLHQAIFTILFPKAILQRSGNRFGMWHGMVHRPDASDILKVYYSLRPWHDKIPVILSQLSEVLFPYVDLFFLQSLAMDLTEECHPIFLCVEYSSVAALKIKVYYRCQKTIQKNNLDHLLRDCNLENCQPTFDDLHHWLTGTKAAYPERSLTLCLGWESSQGSPSLSYHFALNRFLDRLDDTHYKLASLLDRMGINSSIYRRTLQAVVGEADLQESFQHHTMVGFSFAPTRTKINIYMTPGWERLSSKSDLDQYTISC